MDWNDQVSVRVQGLEELLEALPGTAFWFQTVACCTWASERMRCRCSGDVSYTFGFRVDRLCRAWLKWERLCMNVMLYCGPLMNNPGFRGLLLLDSGYTSTQVRRLNSELSVWGLGSRV